MFASKAIAKAALSHFVRHIIMKLLVWYSGALTLRNEGLGLRPFIRSHRDRAYFLELFAIPKMLDVPMRMP
jgi:hypothetical protein